jgi:hypothetical protein
MARLILEKGDFFGFAGGYGIVINRRQAILITGAGGRTGRAITKADIPQDAQIEKNFPYEVSLVLEAVRILLA